MKIQSTVTSQLDRETAEALERAAQERGWSVSRIVREAIREHLSKSSEVKSSGVPTPAGSPVGAAH